MGRRRRQSRKLTRANKCWLVINLLLLVAGGTFLGNAISMWRVVSAAGGVRRIEPSRRRMVFTQRSTRREVMVAWDDETEFIRDGEAVSSSELREGTVVRFQYRTSISGESLARKVEWTASP